jgi:outer membrane protein OmpA-like peptidoglycan-associated protein
MLAIISASLIGAATLDTPCPDGRFVPPGQNCPLHGPMLVFFDSGSDRIDANAASVLDGLAAQVGGRDRPLIHLSGHADRSGGDEANLRLSRRRAEAVQHYLLGRGIRPGCIRTIAHGETRPMLETADGVSEPQNRRVEISFESPCPQ